MPFCMECGQQISDEVKFCPFCGAKQMNFTPVVEPQETIKPEIQRNAEQTDDYTAAEIFANELIPEPAVTADVKTVQEIQTTDDVIDGYSVEAAAVLVPQQDEAPVEEIRKSEADESGKDTEKTEPTLTSQEPVIIPVPENTQPLQQASDGQTVTSEQAPFEDTSAVQNVNDIQPAQAQYSNTVEPPIQPLEPIQAQPYNANEAVNTNVVSGKKEKEPFTIFREKDCAEAFDKADIKNNRVLSALSYFPPLFFLPLVFRKDSRFGLFHANQSLLLTITTAAWTLLNLILGVLIKAGFHTTSSWGYKQLSTVGVILTAIIWSLEIISVVTMFYLGLIDTMNERAKKLPLIGRINLIFK